MIQAKLGEREPFRLETPFFQGPVALLYELIKKEKVDICDVEVSSLARQYLDYMTRGEWDMEEAVGFVSYAALLMLLKSKALLPPDEEDAEEAISPEAEAFFLQELLAERELFFSASLWLEQRVSQEEMFMGRSLPPPEMLSVALGSIESLEPLVLAEIMNRLSEDKPIPEVSMVHMVGGEVSVEERIEWILSKLPVKGGSATFRKIISRVRNKLERIVTLLALLELYRLGKVDLHQATLFGDIKIVMIEDE